jgi:hypothetical protein
VTFEEYAQKHLGTAGLSFSAMELVRMGWNARGSHGNCQGILDSSASEVPEGLDATQEEWARINGRKHIADDRKMVKGNVALAGDITDQDGTTFYRSLLVQFTDDSSLRAAVDSGQCRFTVFGGEV